MALPDQIGRYRIVRQLGQGGMGVVYEVRDDELDRALAIKTIAEPNADAVVRERFRREARAAAAIRHPNVCQVYEIGEHEKALFPGSWAVARDLYLQCLEEDPHYAPAWARIGRIYRVTGKWGRTGSETNLAKAEAAFKRALDINPDLSVAHNLYAQLEVDLGRAEDAMLRLIKRAKARGADPELFAGLVHACRFCGLLDASVAAHHQARRLDPGVATSVGHTYFMLGDYAQVLAEDLNATPNVRNLALAMLGREAEAVASYYALEAKLQTRYSDLLRCARALLEDRREESLAAAEAILASELKDPETLFYLGGTSPVLVSGSDIRTRRWRPRARADAVMVTGA